MFKEIEKEIAETNAFTERLKELNKRLEILLENERQKRINQAAELDRLEREINDIIFDQKRESTKPPSGCMRVIYGPGIACLCSVCAPQHSYAFNYPSITLLRGCIELQQYQDELKSKETLFVNTRPSDDTVHPIG